MHCCQHKRIDNPSCFVMICDGDIVGPQISTFSRSCEKHAVHGQQVDVGSILQFKRDVIVVGRDLGLKGGANQAAEVVVKVVLIWKGGKRAACCGLLANKIYCNAPGTFKLPVIVSFTRSLPKLLNCMMSLMPPPATSASRVPETMNGLFCVAENAEWCS